MNGINLTSFPKSLPLEFSLTLSRPGGTESAPLRFFLRNTKTPWDIEKKLSDFDFTSWTVIFHILSITILFRGCHSNLLFTVCHVIFATEKTKKETWIIFKTITWSSSKLVERAIFKPWNQIRKNFNVWRHVDVTMTKRRSTHISETEKSYCVIMTSF